MDRRLTPFSGRVARDTLRGQVEARSYIPGVPARIGVPVTDLSPEPGALRDRQLVFGAEVLLIDETEAHAFVQATADGYCGWISRAALSHRPPAAATHVVAARGTYLYREASIKRGEMLRVGMGARLAGIEATGDFLRVAEGFVPLIHLRPADRPETDPVAVAERLLGTPYLWGGNSADGIDCSGLVQMALTACGRAAPGDSDLQAAAFGAFLAEGKAIRRGDLLFWRGHVAMARDGATLIHANGHTMTVAVEGIAEALDRIAASGAEFLGVKRP